MPTLTFTFDCSQPPASVLEAAVDFTDRRFDVFPAVEPQYYNVHSTGDKCADVTEGTGTGIGASWERNARFELRASQSHCAV